MFFLYGIGSLLAAYYFTNKYYPLKMSQFKMMAAWYSIKTYCFYEENITAAFQSLRLYFQSSTLSSSLQSKCIVFINANGDEIVRHTEAEFKIICLDKTIKKGIDYEFILYEVLPKDKDLAIKYDKYMLYFEDHLRVTNNLKTNNSIKLLGITIKIKVGEEYYKVSINFGRDNYYIVGNKILSRSFLNWFLKDKERLESTQNVPYINAETKYSVSFIDQKMNCIELNEKQYLHINEEDYSIICEELSLKTS